MLHLPHASTEPPREKPRFRRRVMPPNVRQALRKLHAPNDLERQEKRFVFVRCTACKFTQPRSVFGKFWEISVPRSDLGTGLETQVLGLRGGAHETTVGQKCVWWPGMQREASARSRGA
ncbi:unnamed protein product [Ixodes persulcatus]